METKIDWNKDSKDNARYAVSDGVMTHYVAEEQISEANGEIASMKAVAIAFTQGYDHGGTEDTYAVGWIEDLTDGESHAFAFDGHDNFEWNTNRQG